MGRAQIYRLQGLGGAGAEDGGSEGAKDGSLHGFLPFSSDLGRLPVPPVSGTVLYGKEGRGNKL